jgi:mRNA interferase RelE/StbE
VSFHVEVRRSAEKELGRISAQARQRIAVALLGLAGQPLPPGVKKLKGSDGFRIRIGAYRVLYTIDPEKEEVSVFAVGHRKEVYCWSRDIDAADGAGGGAGVRKAENGKAESRNRRKGKS